ncbi:MAG TPA: hypothetical protein VGH77_11560 [Streptosporangiaceae bacterium]
MPRRIACWLAFAAASVAVLWVGWVGPADHPATLLTRVDVVAALLILALLPWPTRRRFGPTGPGWLVRVIRVLGYAAVFALLLVKAEVERREGMAAGGQAQLAGAWTGEIVFLLVLAGYTAGLLAVTARRPPAGHTALAIGTAVGAAAGLVSYALPPLNPLRVPAGSLTDVYQAGRLLAVPLVLAAGVAAGLTAARRTPARRGRLAVADIRSRQGFAAGLCAGGAAALLFVLLSTGTIVLAPHVLEPLRWTFHATRTRHGWANPLLNRFVVGAANTAAGYLAALIVFPVIFAGLGAWGGMYGADRRGERPGGGGGGGGGGGPRDPEPPPPDGGGRQRDDDLPAILRGGYLKELPRVPGLTPTPREENPAPARTPAPTRYM